jgi:hypothetical protein
MSASTIVAMLLLLLPVFLLFPFAGCTGEDYELKAHEAEERATVAQKAADDLNKKIAQDAKDKADADAAAAAAAKALLYENQVNANPNLVSQWRLNELETGNVTALDSAPTAPLNGVYQFLQGMSRGEAGALTAKDINDKAVEFKGTQGFVEVPPNALRNPPFSFSVELWLLPKGTATQPQVVLSSYELDATGKVVRGYVLDVLRVPTLQVRARLGNGAGFTSLEASLGDGLDRGGWRHVVLTYNAPTSAAMLYVNADDGKADAELPNPTSPAAVTYSAVVMPAATPLRIAAGQVEVAAAGGAAIGTVGQFFEGRIDEVALYRTALDGSTIQNHSKAAR